MKNMYWEYAGTRYNQKLKAIEAAGRDFKSIQFKIFGDTFHTFNWSVEPSQSFKELCDLRATQLRDQYSYIKLYFSGGADSTTMLNAFLRNNIHLDEIVCYRYSLVDDFSCASNFEINHYALPYLKSLNLLNTKIKILDHGRKYFDKLLNNDNYFYMKNRIDLREYYFPKIRGNNFCHLMGDSDPMIQKIDGKWYETIWDTTSYSEHRFRNMEMFFTSENLLELHAKQCHLVKNYYVRHNQDITDVDTKTVLKLVARDNPVYSTLSPFQKKYGPLRGLSEMVKDKVMLGNADQNIRNKYKSILSSTINGRRVVDLYDGIMSSKHYLGDA